MSFRGRLALVAALAVALAVALASATLYFFARDSLRDQVDENLIEQAQAVVDPGPKSRKRGALPGRGFFDQLKAPEFGNSAGYLQVVNSASELARAPGAEVELPVDERVSLVAAGEEDAFFSDAEVEGVHVRILTLPLGDGLALQVARSLEEVDEVLGQLGLVLGAISLSGVALAAGLGLVVTRTALGPIRRLTRTTAHVAETRDLSQRIEIRGSDELSRLAENFNSMLEALDDSQRAQRRLVADASHELRTPLTSLRTNIEVLAASDSMPIEERERLLRDVVGQLEELSILVGDLVDLARERGQEGEFEDMRLDALVEQAVERAERHAQHVRFVTSLEPCVVWGIPHRVDRAVRNLLDNAAKWSPPGRSVEVAVSDSEVTVRDHGPGIDAEDMPFIFDRFYRARKARGMPGSGLGLAIVRHVAESHGGSVRAEQANGGGARLTLRFADTAAGQSSS